MKNTYSNIIDGILDYENGDLDEAQTVELFENLISTGYINALQGSYHRTANELIARGLIKTGAEPAAPVEVKPAPKGQANEQEIANLKKSPFVGIENIRKLVLKIKGGEHVFFIFTYKAYNASGLVGYENNGVGIIYENAKGVLLDQHLQQDSGYYGASQAQVDEVLRLSKLSATKFRQFINTNERRRHLI